MLILSEKIRSKINIINILLTLFIIFIFCLILGHSFSYLDPDLGWHLQVGETVLSEKKIPSLNTFNFVQEANIWVDHEWLSDAGLAWMYDHLGYLFLVVLFTLIPTITVLSILHTLKRYFNADFKNFFPAIILFTITGVLGSLPHLGVRVQEISMLFLALLLILLYRFERTRDIRLLLVLPFWFYLWACLHGAFPIGLIVIFLWLAAKGAEMVIGSTRAAKLFDLERLLKPRDLVLVSVFLAVSAAATLMTPYGTNLFEFLFGYKDPYYLSHIMEWFPLYYLPIQYWKFLYIGFLVVAMMLNFIVALSPAPPYARLSQKYKINIWYICSIFLFLLMSFKSRRHFPLLFIASLPYMVSIYSDYLDLGKSRIGDVIFKYKYVNALLVFLAVFIIGVKVSYIKPISDPFTSFCGSFPCKAVEYVKQNPQLFPLRLLNDYNWGGYLIWALPEMKIFIDGRIPQAKVNGHSYLEEYHSFFKEGQARDKLEEWGIRLVWTKNKEIVPKLNWFEKYFLSLDEKKLVDRKNYFKEYLNKSSEWKVAYRDDLSTIYILNAELK